MAQVRNGLSHFCLKPKHGSAMNNWTRPNRPELEATKIPSAIDVAWSAGIYEGEGTCRLCGHTKRGFMASVTQKDPELLYRLRDWFGGSVRDNGAGIGVHTWDICGDRARIFMCLIYEFLTVRRREQLDGTNALEFLRSASPIGIPVSVLQSKLLSFYEEERDRRISATGKKRRAQRSEYYQKKKQLLTVVATRKAS
jgi:hypothetical protein